jgi:ADP-ribose pyrophosphatase YjhB (NUDIX family)
MPIRLPAPLHRLALRLAQPARLVWWRLAGRDIHGCNALVSDGRGGVLLVRHSYQSRRRWLLPGGGIARGEDREAAAIREVLEETGCRLENARYFGCDNVPLAGCRNLVRLVSGTTADPPRPDGREIVAARFFKLTELPDNLAPTARARIEWWQRWLAADAAEPG